MRGRGVEVSKTLFLLFPIKASFVPVCPEQQTADPRMGSAHLLAHCRKRYIRTALDDEFIVNMTADEAVREGFHRICENITPDRLNDVHHKFRRAAFDSDCCIQCDFSHKPQLRCSRSRWRYLYCSGSLRTSMWLRAPA